MQVFQSSQELSCIYFLRSWRSVCDLEEGHQYRLNAVRFVATSEKTILPYKPTKLKIIRCLLYGRTQNQVALDFSASLF